MESEDILIKILFQSQDPTQLFSNQNILTPEFCELYSYAFCLYLKQKKLAKNGDYIMIASDTRDTNFKYTQALLDGVRKAGMQIRFLGIVPTPALAFYLVRRGRSGALMLTASHNPDDQNGIKAFLPPNAMKLLPEQDQELSSLIYKLKYPIQKETKFKPVKNLNQKVIRKFAKYMLKEFGKKKFLNTVLFVDCANGAVSGAAKKMFSFF